VGVRVPVRESARIFIAGLAMLLTPAYAGEGVKTWLVRRAQPGATTRAAGVVLAERAFDAIALALVAGLALVLSGEPSLGLTLAALAALACGALGAGTLLPSPVRGRGAVLATALALSVLAWLAGSSTLLAVCAGLACGVTPAQAIGTYAASTLLGGLTLLPAGVGVVGTAILLRLQGYGVAEQPAVIAAVLVRLFTVWLTAAIGVAGCWRLARRAASLAANDEGTRFDSIAPTYGEQLSQTAKTRVISRKTALMAEALSDAGIGPGARILDAGCGQGWYLQALAAQGYRVTGIDLSLGQLHAARHALAKPGAPSTADLELAAASTLRLPFRTGAFDAAIAINVLHHVGDAAVQRSALEELARVVRPGGLVFVHEISTVNPLHRLYMSYLFPLLRSIDLGTEHWLDPQRLPSTGGLVLQGVRHYTFLPDFTPAWVYRALAGLERRLERSSFAGYGAHFTAIYVRVPAKVETTAPALGALSRRELVAAR
jgi:2-polyprenyl-3-methyl-5-hydroxy-6-metoxy-1,4-benzoquinol methylase